MEIRYSEKAEKQIRKIYKGNKKTAAMIMAAIESLRPLHNCIKPTILSFRASEARHGIQ